MQILSFDFGTKKIGVAVGQTATYTSSPLQVILNKDDKVILWFVSGNRDGKVFQSPHTPIISRSPNPHISFGQGGVHWP